MRKKNTRNTKGKIISAETLLFFNQELFTMIENQVSLELVARLFSSQLITRGERHLLDHDRAYYKVLRQIISQGQERGRAAPGSLSQRNFQSVRPL